MPTKRNIKPVSASVAPAKPVSKPVPSKPVATTPATIPAVAVNAATIPTIEKPRAAKLLRDFCRKANATGGHAKTAADSFTARDEAYLRLIGITCKRTRTQSPLLADIADDYVKHAGTIFAAHASKPTLDYSVLCGRLPSLGMLSVPMHTDDATRACLPVTAKALTHAAYNRGV